MLSILALVASLGSLICFIIVLVNLLHHRAGQDVSKRRRASGYSWFDLRPLVLHLGLDECGQTGN